MDIIMVAEVVEFQTSPDIFTDASSADATVHGARTTYSPPCTASGSIHFAPPEEFDGKKEDFEELRHKLHAYVTMMN